MPAAAAPPALLYPDEVQAAIDAGRRVYLPRTVADVEALRGAGLAATCPPGGRDGFVATHLLPLKGGKLAVLVPAQGYTDRGYFEELAKIAAALGCDARVVAVPGLVDDDLPQWLHAGGNGATALEALVARVPPASVELDHHRPAGLRFLTARELAMQTPAATPWRAAPYLADGTILELDGVVKGGKTTFVLALARAVLDGRPFLGRSTVPSPVIYLTEQHRTSFRAALERADLLARDDFHLLTWAAACERAWPVVVADAVAHARTTGARVLVVDTLPQWAALAGESENHAGAALTALAPLQAAAAQGLAVIVLRHERKALGEVGESARGSSAFGGAVDVIVALRRPNGRQRPTVRVLHALSRFDETPPTLMVELTDAGYVALGTEGDVATQAARAALLEEAPDNPGDALSLDAILMRRPGVSRATAIREARRLVEAGTLQTVGGGRRGDPLRYFRVREARP